MLLSCYLASWIVHYLYVCALLSRFSLGTLLSQNPGGSTHQAQMAQQRVHGQSLIHWILWGWLPHHMDWITHASSWHHIPINSLGMVSIHSMYIETNMMIIMSINFVTIVTLIYTREQYSHVLKLLINQSHNIPNLSQLWNVLFPLLSHLTWSFWFPLFATSMLVTQHLFLAYSSLSPFKIFVVTSFLIVHDIYLTIWGFLVKNKHLPTFR